MSSLAGGYIAEVGNAAYSASKGALNAMCKVLAIEVAPQKIRANCICPGMVWTPLTQEQLSSITQEQLEANQKLSPKTLPTTSLIYSPMQAGGQQAQM